MHIESRRDEEVTLEFLRGADEALLNVDPQTVRRALAAALVRVVPDREADEGPGPDVAQEVDAFFKGLAPRDPADDFSFATLAEDPEPSKEEMTNPLDPESVVSFIESITTK